jgi:dihydropteroate synthase
MKADLKAHETGQVCDILLKDGSVLSMARPMIMGVLNVTPDSFSDGGRYDSRDRAVQHGLDMIAEGARIIDVGGESTRPYADPVSQEKEIERVIPVIKELAKRLRNEGSNTIISIDSQKPEVVGKALEAGAGMVNDINGLRAGGMGEITADAEVPIVLMHMVGTPGDMQMDPTYKEVISEISEFLEERKRFAMELGIKRERIVLDPGIGFGKTTEHNLEIMNRLGEFRKIGQPILIGTSNKSFIGNTLNLPVEDRLEGTLATVAISVWNGASIIRVHDVRSARRVCDMTVAMMGNRFD